MAKILVGGSFTTLDGLPWRNLGRLNADGSLDTSFNPNPDSPPPVWSCKRTAASS